MIDVREVSLPSKPSSHDHFFEPVVGLPVGYRVNTKRASEMIVWMLQHPGMWLHWSKNNYPVSARPLNNENFDKWRGNAGNGIECGLWIRFNKEGI